MTIIIDCKSRITDKRICVSIDDIFYQLFKLYDSDARYSIRCGIKDGRITNSDDARRFILNAIVKPSIIAKFAALS
jgi:hypothetical protein